MIKNGKWHVKSQNIARQKFFTWRSMCLLVAVNRLLRLGPTLVDGQVLKAHLKIQVIR